MPKTTKTPKTRCISPRGLQNKLGNFVFPSAPLVGHPTPSFPLNKKHTSNFFPKKTNGIGLCGVIEKTLRNCFLMQKTGGIVFFAQKRRCSMADRVGKRVQPLEVDSDSDSNCCTSHRFQRGHFSGKSKTQKNRC